ncbi:MAG: hypothetical protein Fur0043_07390 [Anaerolineales bacterium]
MECIIAPGFTSEARDLLAKKENLRLLSMPDLEITPRHEYRSVVRGLQRGADRFVLEGGDARQQFHHRYRHAGAGEDLRLLQANCVAPSTTGERGSARSPMAVVLVR